MTLLLKCLSAFTMDWSVRGGGVGLKEGPRPRALTRSVGASKGVRFTTALLVIAMVGEAVCEVG